MSPGFTQMNYKYLCKVKIGWFFHCNKKEGGTLKQHKFFGKKQKNSETTQVKTKKKQTAKRDLPFHIVSMDS